jgi:hypothetical protein
MLMALSISQMEVAVKGSLHCISAERIAWVFLGVVSGISAICFVILAIYSFVMMKG